MRRSMLLLFLTVLAALLLGAVPAQAEHRARGRGRVVVDTPRVIVINPDYSSYSHRPRGWDRGRKVGWGACDLPPGLAKKYGCRSTFFGRQRYFDRRFDGRFDRRFRRDSGLVIRIPGGLYLDLR